MVHAKNLNRICIGFTSKLVDTIKLYNIIPLIDIIISFTEIR